LFGHTVMKGTLC